MNSQRIIHNSKLKIVYDKDYEPDFTTKAAMQIRDLLLKNPILKDRLEKSAKNNTLSEFKFTYDDCVQDALVEGYDQNVDFYTLLLNNEEIRAKFANVFMTEVYRILRGPATTVNYTDIINSVPLSKVAEDTAPYGNDKKD